MIDGTHIPIMAPADGRLDYVNRKGWTSIILQAVVDHEYQIRDICCKHPGSCHDAFVLKDSNLFKNADMLIPTQMRKIQEIDVPLMILGDPAYPLLPWIMKGYTGKLTNEQDSFNTYLSSARMAVENTFGRMKGHWRCLQKRIDIHYSFVPKVVSACAILHNIVERKHEDFNSSWLRSVNATNAMFPQPNSRLLTYRNENVNSMYIIREHLKNYMADTYALRSSCIHNL
ncbi:unnamed protein product [Macrosiphum euphorbiae]|nr:unnamed protein product [Macrosiphum euphorbiae]